jgi:hypothetical protein
LEPNWEAWEPILLAMAAVGSFFALMASWILLATVYFLPVWLLGWLKKRSLGPAGSWKLSGAALMPGAVLLVAAVVGYRLGILDLISLFTLFVVHFVVGWVYLVMATLALPKKETAGSPFNSQSTPPAWPPGANANASVSPLEASAGSAPASPQPPAITPEAPEKKADQNAS